MIYTLPETYKTEYRKHNACRFHQHYHPISVALQKAGTLMDLALEIARKEWAAVPICDFKRDIASQCDQDIPHNASDYDRFSQYLFWYQVGLLDEDYDSKYTPEGESK